MSCSASRGFLRDSWSLSYVDGELEDLSNRILSDVADEPRMQTLNYQVLHSARPGKVTRNSSGNQIANVDFFYDDIFNHFHAVRPELSNWVK